MAEHSAVLIVGASKSGKSTFTRKIKDSPYKMLTIQFSGNPLEYSMHPEYSNHIDISASTTIDSSRHQLSDTAKGFVFMIDLSDRQSILFLYQSLPVLFRYFPSYLPLIVIGNDKQPRRVSKETLEYVIKVLEKDFSRVSYYELNLMNQGNIYLDENFFLKYS